MSEVKAYRVDFKYTTIIDDAACMFIVASNPEDAKTGALFMLEKNPKQYGNPEVTSVEEYHKEEDESETPAPKLN